MEKLHNRGCPKHTYINTNGKRQPAHLLIECHEFIWLSQALQEKMQAKPANPPPMAVAFNAPPPPLLPNAQHQSH
jgi:hypothetical protein